MEGDEVWAATACMDVYVRMCMYVCKWQYLPKELKMGLQLCVCIRVHVYVCVYICVCIRVTVVGEAESGAATEPVADCDHDPSGKL